MAFSHSPKIATDGLVFYYDTGNGKSYKGEPTENLIDGATYQDIRNWGGNKQAADITALSETYKGSPVYRLADATGVNPGVYVDKYIMANFPELTAMTVGDTYSFSFDFRVIQKSTVTNTGGSSNGAWVWYLATVNPIAFKDYELDVWYRANIQATVGTTYDFAIPRIDFDNSIVDVCNFQFEKKPHATPFVNGTRSVSGSLLDLTGNSSIDLTNAGFDSNAQLDFDGTNTYIPKFTDSRSQFIDTDLTYEVVVNFNSNPDSYQTLIGLADTNDYIPRFNLSKFRSGTGNNGKVGNVYMQLIDQNGSGTSAGDPDLSGADLVAGGYYHYVGVISKPAGSSTYYVYLYRNGELVTTVNSGRTTYDTTQGVQGSIGLAIGTQFGSTSSVLDGQLPVAKVYNRALTADEVRNNHRHYKNRFNL